MVGVRDDGRPLFLQIAEQIENAVVDGVLYKKRGIGMFVATGARALLLERRREDFAQQFLAPLMAEARKLGMDAEQIKKMIDGWGDEGT